MSFGKGYGAFMIVLVFFLNLVFLPLSLCQDTVDKGIA